MTRRIAVTVLSGLLILLAFVVRSTTAERQPEPKDDDAAQLKALQDERVEVLTKLVTVTTAHYEQGTCGIEDNISAQNQLVAAQLDSTDEPEKRVALLTQQVELANTLLKMAEQRQEAGITTVVDVYRAKSCLLDVKIRLLRERTGQGPQTAPSTSR